MKMRLMLAAAGLLVVTAAGPVMAQATNPTAAGTATAPSAGQGDPAVNTRVGQIATTGMAPQRRSTKKYTRFSSSSRNNAVGTAPAPVSK